MNASAYGIARTDSAHEPFKELTIMNKETTFGISAKGLANLLGIGIAGKSKAEADQPGGELLKARLAGTLPLDTAVVDALPAIIDRKSVV